MYQNKFSTRLYRIRQSTEEKNYFEIPAFLSQGISQVGKFKVMLHSAETQMALYFCFHLNFLLLKLLVLKIQTGANFKIFFFVPYPIMHNPDAVQLHIFCTYSEFTKLLLLKYVYISPNKFQCHKCNIFFSAQEKLHLDGFMRNLNFFTK